MRPGPKRSALATTTTKQLATTKSRSKKSSGYLSSPPSLSLQIDSELRGVCVRGGGVMSHMYIMSRLRSVSGICKATVIVDKNCLKSFFVKVPVLSNTTFCRYCKFRYQVFWFNTFALS